MKVWREKDEKGWGHEGEEESADTVHRTQNHSGHTKRQTYLPVFWQAPKYPAASIHTPFHLFLFLSPPPPTLNTFPLFFFFLHSLSFYSYKICLHIRIFPAFNFQHRQRAFSQPTNENQQKSPKLGLLNRDNNLYSFPNASNIHLPNNKCPANRPALTIS